MSGSGLGVAYVDVLGGGVTLIVFLVVAVSLVLAMGRVPESAFITQLTRNYDWPQVPRRRLDVLSRVAFIMFLQVIPLSREAPQGGTTAERVFWALVILAEISIGLVVWRGTRLAGPTRRRPIPTLDDRPPEP